LISGLSSIVPPWENQTSEIVTPFQ
jgi:hypothetical protein